MIEAVNRIFQRLPDHPNLGRAEDGGAALVPSGSRRTRRHAPGPAGLRRTGQPPRGQRRSGPGGRHAGLCRRSRSPNSSPRLPSCRVGVLVRTNKTVGRLIYELRRRGVEASEEGGNPLTDSAAVLTVLSRLAAGRSSGAIPPPASTWPTARWGRSWAWLTSPDDAAGRVATWRPGRSGANCWPTATGR